MTKLKEILQKSILYMLTAFFTVALWCLLSYAIDVNSNNYYSKGHHDGYQQGYTNALESKFSEFADIIKVDYERTQLCDIKQVLVEKQLYAIMKRSMISYQLIHSVFISNTLLSMPRNTSCILF